MPRHAWMILPALPAALAAQPAPRMLCSIDEGPAAPCTMSDRVVNGDHVMAFTIGAQRIRFVGRSQTGWWSGTLNGRPAMGYELNRGHVRFSTSDLKTSFAWWYPENEHGTY